MSTPNIFYIVDPFLKSKRVPVYYSLNNKIYYDSVYIDNYINNEQLFDGTHDSLLYGLDSSLTDSKLFTNNQLNRETIYGK